MKWTCTDCSPNKTKTQATACPACCGFTSIDDYARGRIGAAVVDLFKDPLLSIVRQFSPELNESLNVLERAAEGEMS